MLNGGTDQTVALVQHGLLTLDLQRYKLLLGDRAEPLSASQMRLLETLMRQPNNVHSIQALLVTMGSRPAASEEALKVCVSRLRSCLRRLGGDQHLLRSVRGIGYIFDPTPAR